VVLKEEDLTLDRAIFGEGRVIPSFISSHSGDRMRGRKDRPGPCSLGQTAIYHLLLMGEEPQFGFGYFRLEVIAESLRIKELFKEMIIGKE
jgi:hypothetical protein